MATKSRFDLGAVPRYLWHRRMQIRQMPAEQGPIAASRSAFWYSLALCLTTFFMYALGAFFVGLFQVPATTGAGMLNVADPRVLVFMLPAGVVAVAMVLSALWAVGLAWTGLFTPGESKAASVNALLWAIALVIFYGGVLVGMSGPGS